MPSFRILHLVLSATFIAVIFSCHSSRENDTDNAASLIRADDILRDVRVLSADDMEGRAPGTSGGEKAARYIARRFKEAGLSPINGSYFQEMTLVGTRKKPGRSSLKIYKNGRTLPYQSDQTLTYWSTSRDTVVDIHKAPLIFVGYGVEAPEYQWDDFKGMDVHGKVLLFLNNDPPVTENGRALFKGDTRTYYGRWTYKFEQAMRHGAAGAIMIHTTPSASYPFSVVQHSGSKEKFSLNLKNSGYQLDLLAWMDKATSEEIARSMGTTLDKWFEMAARRDFKPVDTGYRINAHIETDKRRIQTRNVYGLLEGSDPELKKQIIVFSAHYDHLGTRSTNAGEDGIYNGAWDNALGTASLMSMARAFNQLKKKPKRSVLFLACAAEESGSLGSRWFVARPPVPRNHIVANFNIDMPQIFGLTRDMAAVGLDMNSLGKALKAEAAQTPIPGGGTLIIKGDLNPNAGRFYRSDQINFAKAGIPALYINPGKGYLTTPGVDPVTYRKEHYHQPSDSVNAAWDLSGCERDMRVLFKTAIRVANDSEQPRWTPGNEFETKWRRLYGKN